MTIKIKRTLFIIPAIVASCAIFYMSHQPNIHLPDLGFNFLDKLLHLSAYFIYALAVQMFFVGLKPEKSRKFISLMTMIFASLFALSDEIHQSFIPNRFADFGDWAADFIGIGLSLLLTGVVIKIFKRL